MVSALSVEDCCMAMGDVVGHDSILSAFKMNSAVVVFFNSVEKANELVEKEIVVNNLFTPVLPLSTPSKKVTLSNIPPFVSDDTLVKGSCPAMESWFHRLRKSSLVLQLLHHC